MSGLSPTPYLAPFTNKTIVNSFCNNKDNNNAAQVVEGVEKNIGDGGLGLRSLRGLPTNRRRVASDADINADEKKSLNDNPTEVFLSIRKDDGMSSCKGILLRSDWIITSGRCTDGALNITAWIGVDGTSYLSNHYIKADSAVEHHLISKADIKMSPGFDSTKTEGEFAMLHLNVESDKTAALAKSDFEALGWFLVYDFWSDVWWWNWSDDCWIWDGSGWCNTCTVTCWVS